MSARNNKNLDKQVDEILSDPVKSSRWAALIEGIRIADNHQNKYNLKETDLDAAALLKYVEEKSPILEAQIYINQEE
jgi:hypothetical protein